METMEVKCTCCRSVLIVDRKTGAVVETRQPLLSQEESTGDRFEDAKKLVKTSGERIESKVDAVKKAQQEKLAKLDALFAKRKEEILESGQPIEKPESPFDNA